MPILAVSRDVRLRRATVDDLEFIVATERLDGYDQVVGRWDEARHKQEISSSTHAYFIGVQGEASFGFAILRGWSSPERATLLKRIAVTDSGKGRGSKFLQLVVNEVFRETDAHRLWLGVFTENLRARRAYEKIGFIAEGIARGSAWFGGTFRDELTMALLRPEWQARIGS